MASVILVSENKLKQFTNINKNVDMDVLKAEIQICQDIDLQTVLGTLFYVHLCSRISSTGNTFNADEKTLVDDYIQPYLIQQAYFRSMPALMFRTMNRAIVSGEMENAKPIDIETFKYLRNIQKQTADFYNQRLIDYLNIGYGQNKFPQYVTQSSLDGMVPNRTQKYNPGIVLNHSTRKGYSNKTNYQSYSELRNENPPECW
jgi:hypothetical protein